MGQRQSEENAERPPQPLVLAAGAVGVMLLCAGAYGVAGSRPALAALLGVLAGISLYQARFGFASAWREFARARKGRGLRAQLLLLGLATSVTFPLIAWGDSIGLQAGGFVFPFGVSAALGAFLFGLGMQAGGGCASGTLFASGGGSTGMMITLLAFIAGSVLATAHWPLWAGLPALPALSLLNAAGPVGAWLATAALLGLLALGSLRLERRAHGRLAPSDSPPVPSWRGPWRPETGALMLALVCVLTLAALGRPWGITSGFALWGAKGLSVLGVEVQDWAYWRGQAAALNGSLLQDATSVMNVGIMLGALMAAGLAGRFAPAWPIGRGQLGMAVAGGLLMGYGARLAYGCNIGAYLGGVMSGSLHGWLWLVFGFAGSACGVAVKRRYGL